MNEHISTILDHLCTQPCCPSFLLTLSLIILGTSHIHILGIIFSLSGMMV